MATLDLMLEDVDKLGYDISIWKEEDGLYLSLTPYTREARGKIYHTHMIVNYAEELVSRSGGKEDRKLAEKLEEAIKKLDLPLI